MSGETASPRQLLEEARGLLCQVPADPALSKVLPRAAAVLARQALESQLLVALGGRVPGIERARLRPQLLCLQSYLGDKGLAGEVAHAWWALTEVCHHRLYELAPSASELDGWLETVARFVAAPIDPPIQQPMTTARSHH
jgi:hypothetical protein